MAKAPTTTTAAPTYDSAVQYRVKLTRPVELLGLKLLPRDEQVILGAALNDLVTEHGPDVVAVASPVA